MSCAFDDFIPGFSATYSGSDPLIQYAERVVANARTAGKYLESHDPAHFGDVEAPFVITPGQSGKVRGDVFEMLCRAILWNCAAAIRTASSPPIIGDFIIPIELSATGKKREYALLGLGDNYDLKLLLDKQSAKKLDSFEKDLHKRGTSIKYSTPDIICIDISAYPTTVKQHFSQYVEDLGPNNQKILSSARSLIEGSVKPEDIVFAAGVKTSIRSDRMYQFLYEANSWKFLWARAFKLKPSEYFVLTSQIFGADPEKLRSVDFSSLELGLGEARRAIDGVFHFESPDDLIRWFASSV